MNRAEFYKDVSGEWRWRVIADNGNTLADSAESYRNRTDCVQSYRSMQATK